LANDTNSDENQAVHEWTPEHRDYWLGLAATVGASEVQARFAYALATGMSQTAAAKFAGYKGEPRTSGYAAARSNKVSTLLTLGENDGWSAPDHFVSEEEKAKLISVLMRSGNPQVRLKAIELADRRRQREMEEKRAEEEKFGDPLKTLQRIADGWPLLAAVIAKRDGWAPGKVTIPARSKASALADIREMISALDDIPTDEGEANGRSFATS